MWLWKHILIFFLIYQSDFNIQKILLMPDEMLEKKASDPSIIRNFNKVKTVRENALMIDAVNREQSGFVQFVADWPTEDIIGLWAYLKKHGARLGGNTGPYALRQMGVDTFILSGDVEAYLRSYKIIEGGRDTKRSLQAASSAFAKWQQESGRSLTEISQTIAFSGGDNRVQSPIE